MGALDGHVGCKRADGQLCRVGLLWRGDRRIGAHYERVDSMLGPLFDAFSESGVSAQRVVYSDDAADDVRNGLLGLDGVLVWVNPIQDGATRARLDAVLRDVADQGVWVSAHPDVILKMGTKEVLFHTRSLGWGTDTDLYSSLPELRERMPVRLQQSGRLVLKQARGTGGNGVWRIDLLDDGSSEANARVRVQQAQPVDSPPEVATLAAFIERCGQYFAWSGSMVAQPFQSRLADGMIRCYFVHDVVVGFCHQYPRGLLDASPQAQQVGPPPPRPPMEDPDTPRYQALRTMAENDWVPQMKQLLELDTYSLPVIWDADFLYGPRDATGADTYVLCEINISAVWPFPTQASRKIAEATIARIQAAKGRTA
jgi:hypothetical protein